MATPPSLADVLTQLLNGIQTVLYEIASAIADNATVVASAVVVGALAYMVMRFGSRILRGTMSWFRGLV